MQVLGRLLTPWRWLCIHPHALAATLAGALVLSAAPAHSQMERELHVVAKPGIPIMVDSAGCVKNVSIAAPGVVDTPTVTSPTARTFVIFTSVPDQKDDKKFTADIGPKETADGKGCDSAVSRQYTISFDRSPVVSSKALESSFQILVAAFVLALLLESAFALIFNWRVFEILLVGRAVRTPIMLIGAWLLVHYFSIDLMASLLDAYQPAERARTGSGFTKLLTAMILAGGSVGVNRILVALNFRSLVKDEEPPKPLDTTQAWVSVAVIPKKRNDKVRVDITEVTPAAGVTPPTTIGVAGSQKPTLWGMFLGDNYRVPRSGGIRVDTGKCYTITLRDLTNGESYDVTGQKLPDQNPVPTIFKFGSRAILDFHVSLKGST